MNKKAKFMLKNYILDVITISILLTFNLVFGTFVWRPSDLSINIAIAVVTIIPSCFIAFRLGYWNKEGNKCL